MVQPTCMATCMTERHMHRYLWSSLRPRKAPKATAFDTYLRPGASAAAQPEQAPRRRAADFASYLRQPGAGQGQARDSSSFGAFLKKPAPPKPADSASGAPAAGGAGNPRHDAVDLAAVFLKTYECCVPASSAMRAQVPRQAATMQWDHSHTRQW